jgi:hypothetical protein
MTDVRRRLAGATCAMPLTLGCEDTATTTVPTDTDGPGAASGTSILGRCTRDAVSVKTSSRLGALAELGLRRCGAARRWTVATFGQTLRAP